MKRAKRRTKRNGQPKWKLQWSTDYTAIFKDETGQHAPEMMIAQEYDDDGKTKFLVFRFPLEKLKKVGRYLVPAGYEESWPHPMNYYQPWFADSLATVAESIGQPKWQLVGDITSSDIGGLAMVYEAIGGYHGFENFDTSPQTWSEKKMDEDWP